METWDPWMSFVPDEADALEVGFCVLQCAAACCSTLQRVAACCSVLQYVAVCCSVLQCVFECLEVLCGRQG